MTAATAGAARAAELQRHLAREPGHAEAWHEMGALLLANGAHAPAARAFERAAALAPGVAVHWLELGRCRLALGELDVAHAAFERAFALAPEDARTGVSLADTLLYLGRADDAAARLRAVLARHPGCGPAWWGLANIKTLRFTDEDIAALEQLHAAPAAAVDAFDRIVADFAFGKALEDAGRYADAVDVLGGANAAMRARQPWDRDAFRARLDGMLGAFDALDTRAPSDAQGAEVIFIVSLPRSGSTLVEQILAAHPEVEGASELGDLGAVIQEESQRRRRGFPAWIADATADDWTRLGRRYLERTERWRAQRPRCTDKMPNNWLYLGAALAMLPGARVVDCRRDPLETAWSCFKQLFSNGAVFSYAYDDIAAWLGGYERAMAAWSLRAPGRIHRQDYEALLTEPEASIRNLLDACGLPFDAHCLRFHESTRSVRTASAAQVRAPLRAGTARAARYGALLDPLRAALDARSR
jgi:tetratricopeptide (TPR) repeat protein